MTATERQERAIRAAARTSTACEHLRQALADMEALSRDIGIRHHAETAVKLALREAESADATMQQLIRSLDKIKEHDTP